MPSLEKTCKSECSVYFLSLARGKYKSNMILKYIINNLMLMIWQLKPEKVVQNIS